MFVDCYEMSNAYPMPIIQNVGFNCTKVQYYFNILLENIFCAKKLKEKQAIITKKEKQMH